MKCPCAYRRKAACECILSERTHSHLIPQHDDVKQHQPRGDCPCFPSPVGYDKDGDVMWQHWEIQ